MFSIVLFDKGLVIKYTTEITSQQVSKNINNNNNSSPPSFNLLKIYNKCRTDGSCASDEFYSIQIGDECTCQPKPECLSGGSSSNNCTGLICSSSYKCQCDLGYMWSMGLSKCVDSFRCDSSSSLLANTCDHVTSNGSCFSSGSDHSIECFCLKGFHWSREFKYCVDVDECASDELNDCQVNIKYCKYILSISQLIYYY